MKVQSKRLFINNLPANLTQTDLEEKFAQYGTVASVEIKERKNIGHNQTPHFAYVQLDIDYNILQDCLHDVCNTKWKGEWVVVQEAKESFMERLKREREESQLNGAAKVTVPIYPEDVHKIKTVTLAKKYYSSSSSESDEDSGFNSASKPIEVVQNGLAQPDPDLDGLVVKSNKGATLKGGLKIESVCKQPVKVVEKEVKGAKESEADKKRLESIAQMKKGYQQQKSAIKNALLNIDSQPKNKIIFNDDDTESVPTNKSKRSLENNKDKSKRPALFEDDNEEHEEAYNFELKEQFEGKKGRKLMQLQSKFTHDKRFAMDARFLEDQSDEEVNNDQEQEGEAITLEEEKKKEFEILEQVLGRKVSRRPTDKDVSDSKRHKMMLRFDPSQPEHSKYEVKEPSTVEKSKKKRKESEREAEKVDEAAKPEVSKDTFYKVAVDLKSALHVDEGFSLANMFSKEIEIEPEHEKVSASAPKPQKPRTHNLNPFRYDSTDEDQEKTDEKVDKTPQPVTKRPMRLWTESFFFKDDDYRLQEGLDFIKRLEGDDQGDFIKLRRNLKEIVRAKVRNNLRRNRPFKKKLGGKKRIRVKRAMKR